MRALAGELLLAAWEQGAPEDELRRAVTMLSIALPASDREQLGALPITERNLLLLRLHELSFGPLLGALGSCPKCGLRLEFAMPVAEMAAGLDSQSRADSIGWSEEGRHYQLRCVTTDDLLACLDVPDMSAAQECLLSRCLEVSPDRDPELPTASAAVRQKFEQLHAAAELSCVIECPGCSSREFLDLDMARFLWTEVRNAARRLLGEIHELASAYGWSERAIARMTPGRRDAYLEMLSA
ncbi:MAG TPA: hypothetical protein VHN16_17090 [Streptosporangiaceae bacterium]|nr:hypothetical protein [Streptosporangiaceae bacterium]